MTKLRIVNETRSDKREASIALFDTRLSRCLSMQHLKISRLELRLTSALDLRRSLSP